MTKEQFNSKYERYGGIYTLAQRRDELRTLQSIADEFQVSRGRVNQWMKELFGEKYDPRYQRKEKIIKLIMGLLQKGGEEELKSMLPRQKKSYVEEAKRRIIICESKT